MPHIPKSGEDNVRSGFFALDGYEKVLPELPLSLKCMFVVAYHIGNRKGALLELKWQQVDFKNGVIRFLLLQNRKPMPLAATIYCDVGDWLRRQKQYRDENFPKCEFVFFWYPIDCEIDPSFKGGHDERPIEPGSFSGNAPLEGSFQWQSVASAALRRNCNSA